jgi:hypothetical protein
MFRTVRSAFQKSSFGNHKRAKKSQNTHEKVDKDIIRATQQEMIWVFMRILPMAG